MSGPGQLTGVVLCQVGPAGLAVAAQEIAAIEPRPLAGRQNAFARRAFGLPDQPGRVMIDRRGVAVVVDSLEVVQSRVPLLPSPAAVRAFCGGSLCGFVELRERLWPVVALGPFGTWATALGETRPPGGAPP